MTSKRVREGYLQIDHRASPGIPEALVQEWARAGKVPIGGAPNFESATLVCCHCGTLVVLNPDRTRPRGYCRKCDQYVCDSPGCVECRPFEKLLDDLQNRAYHDGLTLRESGLLVQGG